jgi:hypothetical protein
LFGHAFREIRNDYRVPVRLCNGKRTALQPSISLRLADLPKWSEGRKADPAFDALIAVPVMAWASLRRAGLAIKGPGDFILAS